MEERSKLLHGARTHGTRLIRYKNSPLFATTGDGPCRSPLNKQVGPNAGICPQGQDALVSDSGGAE